MKTTDIIYSKEHEKILSAASAIGEQLNIPVYLVGGYIRDAFLNKNRVDIDIMVGNNVFEFSKKNLIKKTKYKYYSKFWKVSNFKNTI